MKIKITDTVIKSMEKTLYPNMFHRILYLFNDIRWTVKNLFRYRKIVSKTRPWDYVFILEMMKFQLSDLCDTIEKHGNEVDKSRLPKIKNMKRAIELLNNQIEGNYLYTCGYDDNAIALKIENSVVKFNKNDGYKNYNEKKIFNSASKLEEKEWNELFKILKEMRGWWD